MVVFKMARHPAGLATAASLNPRIRYGVQIVVKPEQFARCLGWAYPARGTVALEPSEALLYSGSILKDLPKPG